MSDFMGWFDDTKGKTLAEKLEPALERYQDRHQRPATLVLCNPQDVAVIEGVEVRAMPNIPRNTFHVGVADVPAKQEPKPLSKEAMKALSSVNDVCRNAKSISLASMRCLIDEWEGSSDMLGVFKAVAQFREAIAGFEVKHP